MKKLLLIIFAFAITQNYFSQNYNFENWTLDTVLNLDGYNTMINDNPIYGEMSVIRSTDSYLNNYSIRLETVISPTNDTLFGYFTNGDPETGEGGYPTSLFGIDSVVGYYKYDIPVGDTALFVCMAKSSSVTTGGGIYQITGTQTTWTRFAYYIGSPMADSVIIAAASSNAMLNSGIPGSYLMLDNIQLKYNTSLEQIYNYDFEIWIDMIKEDLDQWRTSNQWVLGLPTMPVQKTTDAYSGLFAVELNTIIHPQWNDTVGGMITNGEWNYNGIYGGQPYSVTPTGVEFYYKYAPVSADTAWVSMQFSKNGTPIAFNGTSIFANTSTYTYFNQVISLPQAPDTLLIAINSGEIPGSQLIIDQIIFTFPVAIEDAYSIDELVAYPIPTQNELNFKFNIYKENSIDLKILDINGKIIINKTYNKSEGEHRIKLNVSELLKGVYVYSISIGENTHTKQFIVN